MKSQIPVKGLGNRGWRGARLRRGMLYFSVIVFSTILLIPIPILPAMSTNGIGWLDGWSHRKSHVINPAPGAGANYQVKIIVHYGYGTDSGADVYCSNQCRTDFGDIRFTDNDGVTLLDYWIEEKTDSHNATFWVEVADDLSSNGVTIYLYYGNSGAASTSNGEDTFVLFDDFLGGLNFDIWYSEGNVSVMGGECTIGGGSNSSKITTLAVYGTGHAARARSKAVADYSWLVALGEGEGGDDWLVIRRWQLYAGTKFYHAVQDGDSGHRSTQASTDVDTNYHTSEIRWINGSLAYTDIDGTVVTFSTANVPDGDYRKSLAFKAFPDLESGTETIVAWCLVRKCADPEPTHGSWEGEQYSWLNGWGYRKSHTIQNASGAGTNYQIRVTVHYGYGTDNLANVYCNERCRSDFGDVRFTDDDGVTLLDYWIENKADWDKATFWVEVVDNLSDNDALIYVYYGNTQAGTTSNGTDTFLVFDDFEDGDTTGWTVIDGSFTASTDYSYDGSYSGKLDPAVSDSVAFAYRDLIPNDYCVVARVYCHQRGDQWSSYALQGRMIDVNNRYEAVLVNQRIKIREVTGGVGSDLADAAFPDSDKFGKWNKLEFRLDGTQFRFWINDTEYLTGVDGTHTSGYIGLRNYKNEPEDIAYFDVVYVRKYTEPEPQRGSWGSEEFNWVAGWSYRKSHIITPAAGAGTNYQVRIIVHYDFGIDAEADVYCGNKCKADFGDIRFTDDDGVTPLDYWIEEKTDYDKAIFWVEIADNLSSNSALIYMYYGNSGANTTSNGSTTFLWFDGFGGTILDTSKWELNNSPVVTVSGGECKISGSGGAQIIFKNEVDYDDVRIDHKAKRSDYNRRHTYSLVIGPVPHRSNILWHYSGSEEAPMQEDITYTAFDGSWSGLDVVARDLDMNQYYLFSQWKTTDEYTPFVCLLDYRQMGTANTEIISDNTFKYSFFIHDIGGGTSEMVLDWVRIRKYVYPEPSHGAWKGSPTDEEPPVINYIAYSPTQPTHLEGVWVLAEVMDHSSLSSVILHFNNGFGWASTNMFHDGHTGFNTTIPPQPNGTQVSFLLEATDTVGNAINSSIYNYTVSDIPPSWTNYTIDARSTLNVFLDVRSNQSIQVGIEATSIPSVPSAQFTVLYSPFSITANLSSGFTITIIYNYSDELLPLLGVDESTLAIYYWNETDNSWNELPTNLDMANNQLTATVDHLTIFAVFGQASGLDIGDGSYLPIMIAGIVLLALFVLSVLGLRFSRSRVPWGEHIIESPARPTEEETVPEETAPEPVESEEPRPLPTSEPICSYCGHRNPAGARYCIRCGRSLGEAH